MKTDTPADTASSARAPRHVGLRDLMGQPCRWLSYEADKADWLATHPQASGEEIERAMKDIATRWGA